MLGEALRVPYRAADATGTLIVGSVLTGLTIVGVVGVLALVAVSPIAAVAVTPVVLLLSLLLRGYLLRVVYAGITEQTETPSFIKWGALLRAGSRSALVSAIYLLPAAVFVGLAAGAGAATVIDPDGFEGALQAVAAAAILVGGFGALCYGLVYLYVRPAARAVLAATGSVKATLDVRRVGAISLSGPYLAGWLIAMGLLFVGPLLIVPLLVVSGIVGFLDPALGAIGVGLCLLLGIVVLFSVRLSAAWATGRGTASELSAAGLIPDTATAAVDSEASTPEPQPEAPPAVQVGRTVHKQPWWREGFRMPQTPLTEQSAIVRTAQTQTTAETDQTQTATETAEDDDTAGGSSGNNSTSSSAESETPDTTEEFEWGPTEKQ